MLSIIESLTTSFAQAAEKENFKEDCIIASSNTVAIYLLPDIMESLVTAFSTHQLFDSTDEFKRSRGYGSK